MKATGGKTVTSYNASNVPLTVTGAANSPIGKAPVLPTSVTFVNGMATVNVTLYDAAQQTLTFSLANGSTAQATVTPAPAALSQFTWSNVPTTVTAGVQATATVTAKDQYGNVETSVNSAPSGFALSGTGLQKGPVSGTASSSVSWSKGVGTVAFTTYKAGTGLYLTASASGGVTHNSGAFTVNPSAATNITSVMAPGSQTADAVHAGVAYPFQVTDSYGNPVPGYVFHGSYNVSPANGDKGTYSAKSASLTTNSHGDIFVVADSSSPKAGDKYGVAVSGINGGTISVLTTVTPGALAQYVMTPSSPVTETSGTAFTVTVTAEDQFGNVETGDNGTLTIYLTNFSSVQGFATASGSTGTVNGSQVTLAGGKANFSMTLTDSSSTDTGTLTLGVTGGTISGSTATITV